MRRLLPFLLCVLYVPVAKDASAAPPRDELLRLVPKDAGFVVVVQDLREHSSRIRQSPFVKLCKESLPGRAAANAPEWRQLAELDAMLTRELGATLPKLRDDVLGDAVVFVWRPGPPDKPDAEDGVVLVRPRDAKLAASVFDHVDAAQTKSGQLKEATTRTHAGQSYRRRVHRDEPDEYQYQRGNLLAFGSSEAMLKQVIEADVGESQPEPPVAANMRALNVEGAAVVWWVNPRAFDAALAHKHKAAVGPEAAMINAIGKHWQAIDGIAGFVQLGDDMRIGIAMSARPAALPASTRRFFADSASASSLVDSFPKDALLTISGRFTLPAMMDAGTEFLPGDAQQRLRDAAGKTLGAALGTEATAALPARLGPDWGVCVTAPTAESKSALPVVTAAVRLDDAGTGPPVAPRVLDGINALATFAAIGYNANHADAIALRSERIGEIEVRYIVGDATLPKGVRPAYAWKQGYLLFASTPDAIASFSAPSATNTNGPVPLMRFAPKAWMSYLQTHKSTLAAMLAVQTKNSPTEVSGHIEGAIQLLKLFNSVELAVRTEPDKAWLELKIVPAAPMK